MSDEGRKNIRETILDGYVLVCDEAGIRIEVTEYHVEPLEIPWDMLMSLKGSHQVIHGEDHRCENFPEGYVVSCDDNGMRVEVTDYHAQPLVISWEKLQAARKTFH